MARTSSRLLVIGPGGSGRTHTLAQWADDIERQVDGAVLWLRGSAERSSTPSGSRRALEVIADLDDSAALAVDDAQWLGDDVVDALDAWTDRIPVAVSTTGWPESASMRSLVDALTAREPARRLAPLDAAALADFVDAHHASTTIDTDELLRLTGGSVALCNAVLEHGWAGDDAPLPVAVVDDLLRRIRASGPGVLHAAQMMAMGVDWAVATERIQDAGEEGTDVERLLSVSGLVAEHELIPLVATAIDADLTDADRRAHGERLQPVMARLSRDTRARVLLAMPVDTSTDETDADSAERALAALRLGDARAGDLVASLGDLNAPGAAEAAFILDMRSLRWDRATHRRLGPPLGDDLLALSAALSGAIAPGTDAARSADGEVLDDLLGALRLLSIGDDAAVARAIQAVDAACARDFDLGAGWSPAALGSLVAISVGDADAAQTMTSAALAVGLGGPGEQISHHLLSAFAGISLGEYSAALDLVRAGASPSWSYRDQVLLAAIDAAIARRSGDTARLRDAWQRSEPLLIRQSVTWLMFDPILEILAAGARLDDRQRAVGLADQLVDQMASWEASTTSAVDASWLRLQLAIGAEDWPGVAVAGDTLAALQPSARRATARCRAGHVWAHIARRQIGDTPAATDMIEQLDTAVELLSGVDDAWEASRLLGQVALDHDDPAVARSLLERARLLVSEPLDSADGLLAAGLSEREAEVARLVVEGRTYKEIGAQLFISAKTVEHHVARVRQRLGAGSRAELLTMVRELSGA